MRICQIRVKGCTAIWNFLCKGTTATLTKKSFNFSAITLGSETSLPSIENRLLFVMSCFFFEIREFNTDQICLESLLQFNIFYCKIVFLCS